MTRPRLEDREALAGIPAAIGAFAGGESAKRSSVATGMRPAMIYGKLPVMVESPQGDSSRLDWDRIEAWSQQLAASDLHQIDAVFEANGAAMAPRLRWSPRHDHLQTLPLRFLLAYWTNLEAGSDRPRRDSVDLGQLAPVRGYELLIDVIDEGRDFLYRYCGATIIALLGSDMTGRRLSELPESSYMAEYAVALYRAAYRRGEPAYMERTVAGASFAWHVLMLPLAEDSDRIGTFLVGAIPVGAAGLPITLDFL